MVVDRLHGTLVFCTDRTGWWNPWKRGGPVAADPSPPADHFDIEPLITGGGVEAEIGGALWVGGLRWWAEIAPGRLAVTLTRDGGDSLAVIEADGQLLEVDTPFSEIGQIVPIGDDHDALVVAGRVDLMGPAAGEQAGVFGRFEAADPNELWCGDALHGPRVGDRKTYLFAFLDDHSRLAVGSRFGYAEDTVRLAAALKPALAARGVPAGIYVDNGSAFCDAWLLRACAKLGVRLVHSQPGRPQGRGKIERFFRTVREQFWWR